MNYLAQRLEGYASQEYADSLAEFGEFIPLRRCKGNLLKREIGDTGLYDASGLYPLFCCLDWSLLKQDLDELPDDIVSVGMVVNPFGDYSEDLLTATFDHVNPYKHHYIVDLTTEIPQLGSRHHRRTARKARDNIQVEVCSNPIGFLDEWESLYGALRKRYSISGIRAFSKEAFREQLSMPEITVHQALYEGEIIGAQLFFCQGDIVAHCHLGAVNDVGYREGAFYALDQFSFEYFSGKVRELDLGGGVGINTNEGDGLCFYKKGWSSHLKQVYFCGRVINQKLYDQLVNHTDTGGSQYFPAYRSGEYS